MVRGCIASIQRYFSVLDGWATSRLAYSAPDDSPDSDLDKIRDLWELRHNGTTDRPLDSDDDGDGLTLLQEYLADTDPNNPDSAFKLSEFRQDNDLLELSLDQTAVTRLYTLLYSTDLGVSDPWPPVQGHIRVPGNGAPMTLDLNNATQGFYTLRAELP